MRTAIAGTVAFLLAGVAIGAQMANQQPTGPAPTCPASGYMPQAYYAMFGQNGGDGQTAFEIASACTGQDVRDVATAIGMGRNQVLGVKNIITIMFTADGTWTDPAGGGTSRLTKTDFHMAYYLPAMRMFLNGTRANGQPLKEIRVFANTYAWNEAQEGRGATAATNALTDRMPLLKLTPFGALWSLIDAEGHVAVSKSADGKTILTGTSPYDGIEVAVTVEDRRQHPKLGPYYENELIRLPVAVTAKANGHVYGARFADYLGGTPLEPDVWVIFPKRLTWTIDGKPLADLTVSYFRSNPYIVFPIPDSVKTAQQPGAAPQLPP